MVELVNLRNLFNMQGKWWKNHPLQNKKWKHVSDIAAKWLADILEIYYLDDDECLSKISLKLGNDFEIF